jgi:molybdopterin-guanine dinucleotide biosynthesis protein A
MHVGGVPLAAWVADRVSGWSGQSGEQRWLSVGPGMTVPGAERFERVVADEFAFGGPLHAIAGVLAQLEADDRLAVVAADMPAITREDVAMLAARAGCVVMGRKSVAVVPTVPTDGICGLPGLPGGPGLPGAGVEPLPSVWRGEALAMVRQAIASGEHALHRLALRDGVICVDVPEEAAARWVNVNRVEDATELQRVLGVAVRTPR